MDLSKFPVAVLFIVTFICSTTYTLVKAHYVKKSVSTNSDLYLMLTLLYAVCTFVLFALGGFRFKISLYSLIIGAIFGIINVVYAFTDSYALKIGPVGLTALIINFSTIITALSGWVFWGESISILKIIGLAFIIACFVLIGKSSDNAEQKKANLKWLLITLFAVVLSALIGLTQKVHQKSDFKEEISAFLIIAFLISCLSSLTMYFVYKRIEKNSNKENTEFDVNGNLISQKAFSLKLFLICSPIIGVTAALNNFINLYLSGVVDTAIFFPLVNGVPLMMVILSSFILFKERLTKKQTVGFICGIIAIVLLCM